MIRGMWLENGTVFFQALPYKGKIYFHEMGFRLSGGLIFKLTEPLMGINDMQMMIRYAVGGEMITDDEIEKIDISLAGRCGGQLMIPMTAGTISRIDGVDDTKANDNVRDFLQYYEEGDVVKTEYIGTLQQLFGRYTLVADNKKEMIETIDDLQKRVQVWSDDGQLMTNMPFDLNRLN